MKSLRDARPRMVDRREYEIVEIKSLYGDGHVAGATPRRLPTRPQKSPPFATGPGQGGEIPHAGYGDHKLA